MSARVLLWPVLALLDWVLLVTLLVAPPLIALFTRAQPYDQAPYSWGGLWGTHDNPPQGDEGFVEKRALFLGNTTGWRGYLNRVHWMIRNPLYGYAKLCAVQWEDSHRVKVRGNPNISDKYAVPGWLFATARNASGKLVAFELYVIAPYSKTRDLRLRLGWKITTSKIYEYGFAQLVNTVNPFDGYGQS